MSLVLPSGSCNNLRTFAIGATIGAAVVWWVRDNYKLRLDRRAGAPVAVAALPVNAPAAVVPEAATAAVVTEDEGFPSRRSGGGTGPINIAEVVRRERLHAIPGSPGVFYNRPRTAPLVSTKAISATRTARSSIDPNTDVAFLRYAKQARRGRSMPIVAGSQF